MCSAYSQQSASSTTAAVWAAVWSAGHLCQCIRKFGCTTDASVKILWCHLFLLFGFSLKMAARAQTGTVSGVCTQTSCPQNTPREELAKERRDGLGLPLQLSCAWGVHLLGSSDFRSKCDAEVHSARVTEAGLLPSPSRCGSGRQEEAWLHPMSFLHAGNNSQGSTLMHWDVLITTLGFLIHSFLQQILRKALLCVRNCAGSGDRSQFCTLVDLTFWSRGKPCTCDRTVGAL